MASGKPLSGCVEALLVVVGERPDDQETGHGSKRVAGWCAGLTAPGGPVMRQAAASIRRTVVRLQPSRSAIRCWLQP